MSEEEFCEPVKHCANTFEAITMLRARAEEVSVVFEPVNGELCFSDDKDKS